MMFAQPVTNEEHSGPGGKRVDFPRKLQWTEKMY